MAEREEERAGERQIVVFELAGETCGMDIGAVREIIRMPEVTHLPDAPDYVEGVANLRGNVIPVIDLRARLGLEATAPTKETRVVVVDGAEGDAGVIVDAVTEVLRLPADAVEGAASGGKVGSHVEGVANLGERLVILLNMRAVLSADGLQEAAA